MKAKKNRDLFEPFNFTITIETKEELQLLTDLFNYTVSVPLTIYASADDARVPKLGNLMETLFAELLK